MEPWMKREIPRPPDYTLEYTAKERRLDNFDVCVQALLEGVLCGHAVLCDKEVSSCFEREAAILKASLFQNGRHCTEKFFKVLKKVKKCSERWMELNLNKILDNLRHLMPTILPTHRAIRMPSKQMFEYLLIRVLGGFHLLLALEGHCREAAGYLMSKISSGHFFCTAAAFLANVARLRALALDLCGQLSNLYDAICPWIQRLKGGSTSALVLQESLPPSLSDYLQQYCSSLKVNSTPTGIKDSSQKMQFSSILNILMAEEDDSRITNQSVGSSGHKRDLRDAASRTSSKQTGISLTDEHQLDNFRPPISAVSFDEDIGVCVDVKRKPSRHFISVNSGNEKRKSIPKTGMEMRSDSHERIKTSCDIVKSNTKVKRKRDAKTLDSSKIKKIKVNRPCEPELNSNSNITPNFIKHYQRVNRTVKEINSVETLNGFLRLEKRRKCEKDCKRVSCLLKRDDWNLFKVFVITRLKKAKKLRTKEPTSHQTIEFEQLLTKTKTRLKFWLLYPHLKGRKPQNWKSILLSIKNENKVRSRR